MQLWLEKVSGIVVSDLFVNNIDLINSFPSLSFDCSKFWNALPVSFLIFFFFFMRNPLFIFYIGQYALSEGRLDFSSRYNYIYGHFTETFTPTVIGFFVQEMSSLFVPINNQTTQNEFY